MLIPLKNAMTPTQKQPQNPTFLKTIFILNIQFTLASFIHSLSQFRILKKSTTFCRDAALSRLIGGQRSPVECECKAQNFGPFCIFCFFFQLAQTPTWTHTVLTAVSLCFPVVDERRVWTKRHSSTLGVGVTWMIFFFYRKCWYSYVSFCAAYIVKTDYCNPLMHRFQILPSTVGFESKCLFCSFNALQNI